jgi:hypothetical protein
MDNSNPEWSSQFERNTLDLAKDSDDEDMAALLSEQDRWTRRHMVTGCPRGYPRVPEHEIDESESLHPPPAGAQWAVSRSVNSAGQEAEGAQEIPSTDPTGDNPAPNSTPSSQRENFVPTPSPFVVRAESLLPPLNHGFTTTWLQDTNQAYDPYSYHQTYRRIERVFPRGLYCEKKYRAYERQASGPDMSRGGRGGFGGGRGNELKGATWAHDAELKIESKPSELFPVSHLLPFWFLPP